MKIKLLILFLLSFVISTAQDKKPDFTDAFRVIDTWVQAQVDYEKLPSVSIAIVKDQETIWAKAYGYANREGKVQATPATVYSICSISKLFTSIAIMQLYEQGKLRLDDSVGTLLPAFKIRQQYEDSGPITVRSLLTHSSGLPRESNHPYWSAPEFSFPTEKEVNDGLPKQETLYRASERFQYSNLGMTLLGEIVAEVSGQTYEAYVEQNILQPLRLSATQPRLSANEWGKSLSVGYSAIKRDGSRDQVKLFDAKGIAAAAGYSSTVEDLARFASWQFRLLEAGGEEILKASTLREMHRVHWVDPDRGTHWGLGFSTSRVDGTNMVGHGGSCPGYRTTLTMDTKNKWAFVAMINAGGESPERFTREIRNIILAAEKAKEEKSGSVKLEDYAGTYDAQPWGSEEVVLPWYGKLAMINLPTNSPKEGMTLLKHVKGDTFKRLRDDDTEAETIAFARDASGKVVRYIQHNQVVRKK